MTARIRVRGGTQSGRGARAGRPPGAAAAESQENNPTRRRTPRTARNQEAAVEETETKVKKLSQLGAAAKLLTGRTKPLTCKEIVELCKERGYWESKAGKTPERTLSAGFDREIASKGSESRFKKVGPGLYLLYGAEYSGE